MTKQGTKTVTVGLTDAQYRALLRLAADNDVRPTEMAKRIMGETLCTLADGKRGEDA